MATDNDIYRDVTEAAAKAKAVFEATIAALKPLELTSIEMDGIYQAIMSAVVFAYERGRR